MQRPEDDLFISIPQPHGGVVHRHWRVTMPRVTAAATLRGQILASMGPVVNAVAAKILSMDPDVSSSAAMLEPGEDATAKARREAVDAARRLLGNARAGRAVRGLTGDVEPLAKLNARGEVIGIIRPTARMAEAGAALLKCAVWAVAEGMALRPAELFGEVDRGRVVRPGLLWQLAFACDLRFAGDSLGEVAGAEEANAAREAGSICEWVDAMDDFLVSPVEAEVLWAFCLLHTFRPF